MVLNYNGLRWLPNCLSSVARTDYPNFDVYLVDNGSVDGSVNYPKGRSRDRNSLSMLSYKASSIFSLGLANVAHYGLNSEKTIELNRSCS